MKPSRRVSPRIPYDESVSLVRTDGNGRLYVRALDLSLGGLHVVSSEACPVGTDVRCTLLLPGGPRTTEGRVIRVTELPRGIGLAIEFVSLEPATEVAIRQLVAARERDAQPAKLSIDGVDGPLRCDARVDAHDDKIVQLSARLPFLRLDGGVGLLLGGEPDEAAGPQKARPGVIRKVELDPRSDEGIPRLAVEVELRGPRQRRRITRSYAADGPTLPPTDLPPPCGQPLPSVVVAPGIERDQRDREPRDKRDNVRGESRPARRRTNGTAEVARRPDVVEWAWTAPPALAAARLPVPPRAARPIHPTARIFVGGRQLHALLAALSSPWSWAVALAVPALLALAVLLLHRNG